MTSVVTRLIPSPCYSSRGGTIPRLLILHTAEGADEVTGLGAFFARRANQVSSGVGIDDLDVARYVPDIYASWTARDANPVAIQAELCAFAAWSPAQWAAHPGMLELTARWLAETATTWRIPLVRLVDTATRTGTGVCTHADITRGWRIGSHTDTGLHLPLDKVLTRAVRLSGRPAPTPPVPAPTVRAAGHLDVDGDLGPATIRALQRWLDVVADSRLGPITIRALQRHLKVSADGVLGPVSVAALQRRCGLTRATVDGSWGPATTKALQRSLNDRSL